MENTLQQMEDELYGEVFRLLASGRYTDRQIISELERQFGLDETAARYLVEQTREYLSRENRKRAGKNLLFGALWLVGGLIATSADLGLVFWGAILFGAIQFLHGLFNYCCK